MNTEREGWRKSRDSYPLTREDRCIHCRLPATWRRMGTGEPWRGGYDYWYTTDHQCPEGTQRITNPLPFDTGKK